MKFNFTFSYLIVFLWAISGLFANNTFQIASYRLSHPESVHLCSNLISALCWECSMHFCTTFQWRLPLPLPPRMCVERGRSFGRRGASHETGAWPRVTGFTKLKDRGPVKCEILINSRYFNMNMFQILHGTRLSKCPPQYLEHIYTKTIHRLSINHIYSAPVFTCQTYPLLIVAWNKRTHNAKVVRSVLFRELLRTISLQTTSQVAPRNCSEELREGPIYRWIFFCRKKKKSIVEHQ